MKAVVTMPSQKMEASAVFKGFDNRLSTTVYIEFLNAFAKTSAILGIAILGEMVLGDEGLAMAKLSTPVIKLEDDALKLSTPVIWLEDDALKLSAPVIRLENNEPKLSAPVIYIERDILAAPTIELVEV